MVVGTLRSPASSDGGGISENSIAFPLQDEGQGGKRKREESEE